MAAIADRLPADRSCLSLSCILEFRNLPTLWPVLKIPIRRQPSFRMKVETQEPAFHEKIVAEKSHANETAGSSHEG